MLADQFDAFLFDLDGVVHVGPDPLPNAVEALSRLRRRGKAVRFLTNDPRPTRAEVVDRLTAMGVQAELGEIVTAGWATAVSLKQRGVATAYVVGSRGLAAELRDAGIDLREHGQPEAVVVGCDETVGYPHLRRAATFISRGAQFIATNPDPTFPTAHGPWPATGTIAAAISTATGIRPLVIGKPAPAMFHAALTRFDAGTDAVVVGDTPATDILGAQRAGLPAILVADQPLPALPTEDPRTPETVIPDLSGLFDPAQRLRPLSAPTFPWPQEVRPGVAAVVFDDAGRVLLMRRADNGLWGLPSGHVEPGETVARAVVREVLEETGLQVRVSRLVGLYSDPASQVITYADGRVCHFITASFACTVTGGDLRADGVEALAADFFPTDHLPTDLMPMHPRWLTDALDGRTGAYR